MFSNNFKLDQSFTNVEEKTMNQVELGQYRVLTPTPELKDSPQQNLKLFKKTDDTIFNYPQKNDNALEEASEPLLQHDMSEKSFTVVDSETVNNKDFEIKIEEKEERNGNLPVNINLEGKRYQEVLNQMLERAIVKNQKEVVAFLINHGANINDTPQKSEYKLSPVSLACHLGHFEILEGLLSHPQVGFQNDLLHCLLRSKEEHDEKILNCFSLVINDARCTKDVINAVDSSNRTPLSYIMSEKSTKITKMLMERDAVLSDDYVLRQVDREALRERINEIMCGSEVRNGKKSEEDESVRKRGVVSLWVRRCLKWLVIIIMIYFIFDLNIGLWQLTSQKSGTLPAALPRSLIITLLGGGKFATESSLINP